MIKILEVTGVFTTNSYFLIDEETKHGFLIDPGAEAKKLLNYIKENDLVIEKILITHSHFDHIGAVREISETLNIPVYIHKDGDRYAKDTVWNLSSSCGENITIEATNYIKDNDVIKSETTPNLELKAIHVAGHTLDGVIFYSEHEKAAFVGDNIFCEGMGRSDFYGGDLVTLFNDVINEILTLPDDTILYPGHGESTTVEHEKKINPYFIAYNK